MTMVAISFALSAALYAVACAAFFVHLSRGTKPSASSSSALARFCPRQK